MSTINQRGSALITLIFAMVLMAALGIGIYTLTTSSTFGELLANRNDNAYQLAKAGIRYAIDTNGTVLGDFLVPDNSKKFNLAKNGNNITSTGIVNEGTFLEARRVLNYTLPLSATAPANNQNVVVTTFNDLNALDLTKPGYSGIVHIQDYIATGGYHVYWAAFMPGSSLTYYTPDPEQSSCYIGSIVVPISNVSPTYYRDVLKVSKDKYGQLTYDVQVKVGWYYLDMYGVSGITFRWHQSTAYPGKYEGYGLSFIRYNSNTGCSSVYPYTYSYTGGDGIPNGIKPPGLSGKSLLVLWRQKVVGGIETKVWLAYAILGDPNDRPNSQDPKVVGNQTYIDGFPITDDSSLIVRVADTIVNGQRVNKIKLFYGDASPNYEGQPIRTPDIIATNIQRQRYSPQWVDNSLFPRWPSNKFDPSTGVITSWHPDAHTYDWYNYFTLASTVPTSPNNNVSLVVNNALVKTALSSGLCATGDVMCLLADQATILTNELILNTYEANREEVGLIAMGNLNSPYSYYGYDSIAFDDFVVQILGVHER